MGWGLLRTRDSTLVNATRSRQVWTRLYLDENEEEKREFIHKNVYGYGFCYAYRREVAKAVSFGKTNDGEDYDFFQKAEKLGFRVRALQDTTGRVLHMMHDVNTTLSFPQYSVPPFMVYNLFPDLGGYLQKYPI